jgi:esterase/lipase superfamily enzyme
MSTRRDVAFLEMLRDLLDQARELIGDDWPDFSARIQSLLLEIAQAKSPDETDRLVRELIERTMRTPAKAIVQAHLAELSASRAMGAPEAPDEIQADPNAAVAASAGSLLDWLTPATDCSFHRVPVFFATDRGTSGRASPNDFFGGQRGASLTYGMTQVSIPDHHRVGSIERPRIFPESPKRHVTLLGLTRLSADQFVNDIGETLRAAPAPKLLVFVHGYRTRFADAVRTAAQLTFDLNLRAIPILYSWPSKGRFFAYPHDEANAAWTREHFIEALKTLDRLSDRSEQHLLAHSMGNRVVFQGLQFMNERRFGQIILAAPDEDAQTFESQIPRFIGRAKRNTLYASSRDFALAISNWIHGSPRSGQIGFADIDTIDASAVNFSLFGHSYFQEQRDLLQDIFLLVEHGLPPEQRPLLRRTADGLGWQFQR